MVKENISLMVEHIKMVNGNMVNLFMEKKLLQMEIIILVIILTINFMVKENISLIMEHIKMVNGNMVNLFMEKKLIQMEIIILVIIFIHLLLQ